MELRGTYTASLGGGCIKRRFECGLEATFVVACLSKQKRYMNTPWLSVSVKLHREGAVFAIVRQSLIGFELSISKCKIAKGGH